jgi:hypothetical protein
MFLLICPHLFAKKMWGQKKAQFRYFFLLFFHTNVLFYCLFNNKCYDKWLFIGDVFYSIFRNFGMKLDINNFIF